MKPPIAVALITNEQDEILVGRRCDSEHEGELELLGGRQEDGENIEHTAQREIFEETGSHVRTLGLVATLHFEDDGEMREAQIWNAELLGGPELYPKEPAVHDQIEYYSLEQLAQLEARHTSHVLRALLAMMLGETLQLTVSYNSQRTWHKRAASGIN